MDTNERKASASPKPLRVAEAAAEAEVNIRTISRWVEKGLFIGWRRVPGGSSPLFIDPVSFRRFLRGETAAASIDR